MRSSIDRVVREIHFAGCNRSPDQALCVQPSREVYEAAPKVIPAFKN